MSSRAAEEAARAGWDLYRRSGYALDLNSINGALVSAGQVPVSTRMFDHYRRLHRRGYRHYVPINRLDTLVLADPLYYQSVRSRYSYYETDSAVRLIVDEVDASYELAGTAIALSSVGVDIRIEDSDQVDALSDRSLPASTPVTVDFLDPPATFRGRIDSYEPTVDDRIILHVSFVRLAPIQEITRQRSLAPVAYELTVVTEARDVLYLDEVSRELFLALQAIEAARAVTNEIIRALGADDSYIVAPPTVTELSMRSPLVLELGLFSGVVSLVSSSTWAVLKGRDWWYKGTISKRQAELLAAEADLKKAEAEAKRAETASQGTSSQQPESLRQLIYDVLREVRDRLPIEAVDTQAAHLNVERIDGLLTDELAPAIEALRDQGVIDMRFRRKGPESDDAA